jgi:hypothetical protein
VAGDEVKDAADRVRIRGIQGMPRDSWYSLSPLYSSY